MTKVLVAAQKPFAGEALEGMREIVEKAGFEFLLLENYESQSDLIDAVKDVDALIVRSDKVTAEVLQGAQKLKIVVRAGAGVDNLDIEAIKKAGVVAMNTPGQNSNAVAELAISLMIFMARNQFTPIVGNEIQGKTLGIQAFGNVGRLVAIKAKALGMKVKAFDPFLSYEEIAETGAEPVASVEELYSHSDYVSVHIPASPQTIGSIGYDLLSKMPEGATLINTARKEVIDEDGLYKALVARKDLKYATDVAPDIIERLKTEFESRVFATPGKMGAQTVEANLNAGLAAAHQVVDFIRDGVIEYQL